MGKPQYIIPNKTTVREMYISGASRKCLELSEKMDGADLFQVQRQLWEGGSVRAGGPLLVSWLVNDGQQIQLVTVHQLLKLLTSCLSFTLLFHPP